MINTSPLSFGAWVFVSAAAFSLAASGARAEFDPPAGYYSSATGTGATLKGQLHNIIDGHFSISYSSNRDELAEANEDPNNPNNLIVIYDGDSLLASNTQQSTGGWNREHVWPRSRGISSSGIDNTDLHNLRPSYYDTNSNRGNLNFSGDFGSQPYGQYGSFWYPGQGDTGHVARAMFYMAVRYDGSDSNTTDLELVNGNPGINGTTLGDLESLLEWHYEAPPEEFERRRNDVVYGYQNNRNPFVDHPEWVHSIFVDQANDTHLSLTAASGNPDGSSAQVVDLGRALVGGPGPNTQQVTLFKTGNDGTYYSATTSGAATSSVTGVLNAFAIGSPGSQAVTVGLNADTSQVGLTTGEVTFDNLDITTGGGAGRGANDADDVVNLSFTTVDHATPSWSGSIVDNALTIDFGVVDQGSTVGDIMFDLFNLEQTLGFTADLELDSISGSGDTGALSTDLAPLTGASAIAGGGGESFFASIDTSFAGDFDATYTLNLSDEDLAGAQLYQLTLNLLGTVVDPTLAGDFNGDDAVTAADYSVLRDGVAGDYATWAAAFGDSQAVVAATAVPEPSAGVLMIAAAIGITSRRARTRRTAAR